MWLSAEVRYSHLKVIARVTAFGRRTGTTNSHRAALPAEYRDTKSEVVLCI